MKWLLLLCVSLTGCYVEEGVYTSPPPDVYENGTVEFCDDFGCREVTAPYYRDNGSIIYYDAHFDVWIGAHGYWQSGHWCPGYVHGYHNWYHEREGRERHEHHFGGHHR